MKILNPQNNDIVRKSEAITRARYKLNPLPLKFITAIIANIKRSDDPDKEYIFRVKDFAKLIGVEYAEIYNELEDAVEELLKKPLHIKTDDGWLKANWISDAEYKQGEGCISFTISQKLRPYLLALQEKFLQYRLENILKLRSGYSIRMYEILKDWFNKEKRYNNTKKVEKTVEVKWLREILEVPKSYHYGNSSGIKYRIIEKAKKDLEKYTDLKFDYEEIKTGRKVTHLKFNIQENEKNAQALTNDDYAFMRSKRAFIGYLRKHYVNRAVMAAPNANFENQISKWSISPDGLIYDMRAVEENVNATRSDEIYTKLYQHAKKSENFQKMLAEKKEFEP